MLFAGDEVEETWHHQGFWKGAGGRRKAIFGFCGLVFGGFCRSFLLANFSPCLDRMLFAGDL